MNRIITLFLTAIAFISARAYTYEYTFRDTPVAQALVTISKEHPEVEISFIYNELDRYLTSSRVATDDAYEAVRKTIGLNPVTVATRGNGIYVEALQRGKYEFYGRIADRHNDPVGGATILILNPRDSTVITYGVSDDRGRFRILCDKKDVIAKISCLGYRTLVVPFKSFAVGTIVLTEDAIDLKAVTVKADYARAYSDRTVYIPNTRQKNAAQDATDLLRFMVIPQIRVRGNSVTDNTGEGVTLFINGVKASHEELEGMRTADVRRVEYLEYPTDPRFRGVKLAINFIVQEYAYGGYTKLSGEETFMIGLANSESVFSKFNYGKMSYDIFASTRNADGHHNGGISKEGFLITGPDGKETMATRDEETTGSYYRKNVFPFTFRATYNTDKVQIRNTLGFTHTSRPVYDLDGIVTINGSQQSDIKQSAPMKTNSASYSGDFYFALPRDFAINVSTSLNYSHTDDRMKYTVDNNDFLTRNARENACNYDVEAISSKTLGEKHTLAASVSYSVNHHRLRYSGTDSYDDRFMMQHANAKASYSYRGNKVYIYSDAGFAWEDNDINGKNIDDVYPFVHFNFQYSPGKKHKLSTFFQCATSSPAMVHKVTDILKENEFLYISGNPDVKNARLLSGSVNYTWLPANFFNISLYGKYYECFNRLCPTYSPYDDGRAVIRSYANDGNYTRLEGGASVNLNLLDGRLLLNMSPSVSHYRSTGTNRARLTHPSFHTEAEFYAGSFNFGIGYSFKDRYMFQDDISILTTRNFHYFNLGWANRNVNVRLWAIDMFNKGWKTSETGGAMKYYTYHAIIYGVNYHPRLYLTLTYTFGYGKKVKRGNEVGEQSGTSSAILK